MKKTLLIVLIVVSIGIIVTYIMSTKEIKHNTALEKTLNDYITSEQKAINLKKVHPTNWYRAYIFGPYTTKEMMEEKLGFRIRTNLNLEYRDDVSAIVILNEDSSGEYVLIKRSFGDIRSRTPYITPERPLITFEAG
ncbi:MAG: hypothetical protein ACRCWQ_00560 [Bacilli bacterium]